MKIIIAPAKKMTAQDDSFLPESSYPKQKKSGLICAARTKLA